MLSGVSDQAACPLPGSNVVEPLLESQPVKALQWKARQKFDATPQDDKGVSEGAALRLLAPGYRGGVRYAPMGGMGCPGQKGHSSAAA